MLARFVSLTLFSVLLINLAESKPNCQKCLTNSANYIDHYKYLECKQIANKDCPQCIDRFDCPTLPLEQKVLDVKKCHIANRTYEVGETILSKRKFCKYCSCVEIPLGQPENNTDEDDNEEDDGDDENASPGPIVDFNATALLMNRPDPPKYNPKPIDNNYEARMTCAVSTMSFNTVNGGANEYCFYKESECSGTRHCISREKLEKEHCVYQGKKFAYGEMIYPEEEDHCLKCKCSSSWTNNINQIGKQCERISCDLEDSLLNNGCIPIYENKCCPNNYHCPNEKPSNSEPVKEGKCYFNGKNYDIGTELVTDNACLTCSCKVPPYHTCVTKDKCEE